MHRIVSFLASTYISARVCSFCWLEIRWKTAKKYNFSKTHLLFCTVFFTSKLLHHCCSFEFIRKAFFSRILGKKKFSEISNMVWNIAWYLRLPHLFDGPKRRRFVTSNCNGINLGLLHLSDVSFLSSSYIHRWRWASVAHIKMT